MYSAWFYTEEVDVTGRTGKLGSQTEKQPPLVWGIPPVTFKCSRLMNYIVNDSTGIDHQSSEGNGDLKSVV